MNRLHIIQLQSVGPFERVYPTPIESWWKPYKLKVVNNTFMSSFNAFHKSFSKALVVKTNANAFNPY